MADSKTKGAGGKIKDVKMGRFTIRQRNAISGYAFIMPWILGFLLFTAFPFFYSMFLSFNSVNFSPDSGIQTTWIGFKNYMEAFTKDAKFPVALSESAIFVALSAPMIVIASLLVALMLNRKFRGRSVFRAVFFLPVIIISGPVISELTANKAAQIVDPARYFIYKFFTMVPPVVGAPILYIFDNLVMILWFSGVQILIFLSGLQKIDSSIHEAAQIDGASSWEFFWKIILPFVKPFALVNAIYTIVETATFANNKVNTEITNNMFQMGKVYSYSAALSWIYFVVELVLLGVVFLLLKEKRKERWTR